MTTSPTETVPALKPGDRVTWLSKPRGGYSYIYPVAAVVERVTAKRVAIKVFRISGPEPVAVLRWVKPDALLRRANTNETGG